MQCYWVLIGFAVLQYEQSLMRSIMRRIMWLSVNRLSVDQGHKKKKSWSGLGNTRSCEIFKKKKKKTNLQFYFFIDPGSKVLLLFYTQPTWMHLALRHLYQHLRDVSDRDDLQISEMSLMRSIKDVSSEMSHVFSETSLSCIWDCKSLLSNWSVISLNDWLPTPYAS